MTKEQDKVFKFITEECTKIALEKLHHYFIDFTCYDIPRFIEFTKTRKQAFWMIRDSGTDLLEIFGSPKEYAKNNTPPLLFMFRGSHKCRRQTDGRSIRWTERQLHDYGFQSGQGSGTYSDIKFRI